MFLFLSFKGEKNIFLLISIKGNKIKVKIKTTLFW